MVAEFLVHEAVRRPPISSNTNSRAQSCSSGPEEAYDSSKFSKHRKVSTARVEELVPDMDLGCHYYPLISELPKKIRAVCDLARSRVGRRTVVIDSALPGKDGGAGRARIRLHEVIEFVRPNAQRRLLF